MSVSRGSSSRPVQIVLKYLVITPYSADIFSVLSCTLWTTSTLPHHQGSFVLRSLSTASVVSSFRNSFAPGSWQLGEAASPHHLPTCANTLSSARWTRNTTRETRRNIAPSFVVT